MVSWEFPPLVVGGLSAHVHGLSKAMAAAGHEVVVLTRSHPDAPDDSFVEPGLRVLRAHTDLPWLPAENFVAQVASANHQLTKLVAALGDWRPQIVHAHDWLGVWTGDTLQTIWNVPLIATVHATERGRHQGHLPNANSEGINACEWWLTYQSRRVICCSQFMVDQVLTSFQLPVDKVDMVPNGVDASSWKPTPRTAPLPPALDRRDGPVIVSWGRIEYEKGFQTLIDAMPAIAAQIPGAHAVIVGRGSYASELQRQAQSRGLEGLVHFAGFVSDDDLRSLLNRAGCAVLPSLYEPFGIVALEAMAAGAPVVAAASGGLQEVLAGTDAGLLFPPNNPDGLARAAVRMLADPSVAERSRRNAERLLATRYHWSVIAEETLKVYERVLDPAIA